MKGTIRLVRTAASAAIGTLLLVASLPAMAATSTPSITGRVVDATHHRPVADQPVTLLLYRNQTRLSTTSTKTNANGAFWFASPTVSATGFQVATTYQGGTYRTPLIQLGDSTSPVTVKVFASTSDPAAIRQTSWVVWVDPMPGGIVVQQDFGWRNPGTTAYVGRGGVVTEVPLAPGATDVQYLGLYLNGGGRIVGDAYEGTQPIVPGRSSATVRYIVPSLSGLHLVSPLATGSLHVFVASDLAASAPRMSGAGTITDRGTTYQVLTAANAPAGRAIEVDVKASPRPRPTAAWPFALAGLVLLVLVGVLFVRRYRGGGASRGRMSRSPRRTQRLRQPHPSRPSSPVATSDEETEALLEEIAAIDVAFEEGLLDPAAYERVRAAVKERLASAARSTFAR